LVEKSPNNSTESDGDASLGNTVTSHPGAIKSTTPIDDASLGNTVASAMVVEADGAMHETPKNEMRKPIVRKHTNVDQDLASVAEAAAYASELAAKPLLHRGKKAAKPLNRGKKPAKPASMIHAHDDPTAGGDDDDTEKEEETEPPRGSLHDSAKEELLAGWRVL